MSPSRRALFARAARETARLTPEIGRAILAALKLLASEMTDAQLAEAVANGSIERLLTRLLAPEVEARAFYPVREAIRIAVGREARLTRRDLPRPARGITATAGIGFDVLNPRVIEALRRLETRVIAGLAENVRGAVRAHIEAGMALGQGPAQIARGIRGAIPLGPSQVKQVANFRAALRGERPIAGYTLRNHTVDRLLKKGPLTAEQVARYTEAYRKARVAQNAATVARTVALDSFKLGQRLSWQDAIDKGYVDGGSLMKEWVQVDRPTKRDEHVPMHGEVAPFDEPYSNGDMDPGENDYNCACLSRVFVGRG